MESNISPIDDTEESEEYKDEPYLIGTGTKPHPSAEPREDAPKSVLLMVMILKHL